MRPTSARPEAEAPIRLKPRQQLGKVVIVEHRVSDTVSDLQT
jgi:hypothetical protein